MSEIKEKTPLRIFLCHSSGDKPRVRNLYQQLSSERFDPWLDEEKLLPGQEWKLEIPKAVRASHIVIICLSSNAINKKGYVQKEIKYALDVAEEQPEGTIFLIPLKLEECDVPERLRRWHWVNYYEEKGYERLMSSLRMRAETISSGGDSEPDIKLGYEEDTQVKTEHKKQIKDEEKQITTVHGKTKLSRDTEELEIISNSIEMQFILIKAGEFMMGSEEYDWEKPVHNVKISESFYLGIYPVTQREWNAVMGQNPSYFNGDDLPVEKVSWDDVQEFIQKLNDKEGTDKYRLPSDAEWEYAVRAGTTTRYSFGDDESELEDYAWYWENSEGRTHPVGQKKSNSWELYDMHGNVWEWVQDEWHSSYEGAPTDGSAWEDGSGAVRVIRGGGWGDGAGVCRSAVRGSVGPGDRGEVLGFRLLQEL